MFTFARKPRKTGQVSCIFAIGYGTIRFVLEFFREPDAFATGIVHSTGLSLGQFYSIPMILLFIFVYWRISVKPGQPHQI
jgi:phosphatidylglycerol:prolipoprotein diacylglycerol transferase